MLKLYRKDIYDLKPTTVSNPSGVSHQIYRATTKKGLEYSTTHDDYGPHTYYVIKVPKNKPYILVTLYKGWATKYYHTRAYNDMTMAQYVELLRITNLEGIAFDRYITWVNENLAELVMLADLVDYAYRFQAQFLDVDHLRDKDNPKIDFDPTNLMPGETIYVETDTNNQIYFSKTFRHHHLSYKITIIARTDHADPLNQYISFSFNGVVHNNEISGNFMTHNKDIISWQYTLTPIVRTGPTFYKRWNK